MKVSAQKDKGQAGDVQKGGDPSSQEDKTAEVRKASESEYMPALVGLSIPPRVRIVKNVIALRMVGREVRTPSRWIRG